LKQNCSLLFYYESSSGSSCPTIRDNPPVPFSRGNHRHFQESNMGRRVFPETSTSNCHSSQRNNLEEQAFMYFETKARNLAIFIEDKKTTKLTLRQSSPFVCRLSRLNSKCLPHQHLFKIFSFYINKIQRDATVCRCLFTAKLLYVFRVSIAPIIRSTSKCNCSFRYRSYHISDPQPSTSVT